MKVRVKKASAPTLKRAERKPEGTARFVTISLSSESEERTFKQLKRYWEKYWEKYDAEKELPYTYEELSELIRKRHAILHRQIQALRKRS